MWWRDKLLKSNHPINPIFWLWLPCVWIIFQVGLELFLEEPVLIKIHSESGLHEWLQIGLIFTVLFLSLKILLTMNRKASPWIAFWVLLAAIGSLYTGMEEMSWGQSIFKWDTPQEWREINQQNETNLHNTSRWFNQKPRLLLEVGVITGGLLLPLLSAIKPAWLPKRFALIYPANILAVTAAIYTIAKFAHKFSRIAFDTKLFYRASEVEELYLYYFLVLYIIILAKRITENASK